MAKQNEYFVIQVASEPHLRTLFLSLSLYLSLVHFLSKHKFCEFEYVPRSNLPTKAIRFELKRKHHVSNNNCISKESLNSFGSKQFRIDSLWRRAWELSPCSVETLWNGTKTKWKHCWLSIMTRANKLCYNIQQHCWAFTIFLRVSPMFDGIDPLYA